MRKGLRIKHVVPLRIEPMPASEADVRLITDRLIFKLKILNKDAVNKVPD